MRTLLASPALLLLAACGAAAPPPLHPAAQRLRDATGGARWDAVAVIESRGTLSVGGLEGRFETVEDLRDGRRRTRYVLGPATGAEGFDGAASWSQDAGGEVVVEDAPEAVARARTDTWLARQGYFRAGGASYRDGGERAADGARHRVVEVTPEGGAPVELWFDARTGLLARTVERDGQDTITTILDDYREVDGVRLPFRTVVDVGDPRNRMTMTLTEVRLRGPLPAAAFARPETTAMAGFAGGLRRTELVFELVNNHIFVQAEIAGAPVRMLVDTGGLNLLTPAAAARLGLRAEGRMAARGAGEQEVDVALARAAELAVGDVRLRDPVFYVMDLGELLDVEGEDFDGLVGFELFHRFVVRIDYAGRRLALIEPADFAAPAGATAIPFELHGRIPVVAGSIDGIPARFTIDTGARGSLTTHGPFTREHGLVERYRAGPETVTGWGVGGPARGRPVRFGEVRLGPLALRDIAGDLFTGDKGALADPDASANLGGGILRRFAVTFDYGKRTMYLEPGPGHHDRDPHDRLGAWLLRAGDALRITAITPDSPAERTGLRPGDRILAIDGAPAASRRLHQWRARFRQDPPGTRIAFTIDRGGQRLEVTATLADLVP